MTCLPRRLVVAAAIAFVVVALVPVLAVAQEGGETAVTETGGYDVDFTLPTAAKAGCMVCHGDENLIRLREDQVVSFYVDATELEAGPHAAIQCAGCHLNFAFTLPHGDGTEDWRPIAKSACKNCHQDQYVEYGQGVHRIEVGEDGVDPEQEKPLCGDCHGSHDILALVDNAEGQRALRDNAWNVCGRCHEEYWESYNDYYHGRAFKRGAYDAPSCWDCHGYHDVKPASDRRSMVHETRLEETCGACHPDISEGYLEYAELIHGQQDAYDANPVYTLFQRVRSFFGRLLRIG